MGSIEDFKKSCNDVSLELAKIEKRKHSIENLKKGHAVRKGFESESWLPCCYPGIPCTSRANIFVESDTKNSCKTLITVCSESKSCIHSMKMV